VTPSATPSATSSPLFVPPCLGSSAVRVAKTGALSAYYWPEVELHAV
jgi:hypothetical protein